MWPGAWKYFCRAELLSNRVSYTPEFKRHQHYDYHMETDRAMQVDIDIDID